MKVLKVTYGEKHIGEWAEMALKREFEKRFGYKGEIIRHDNVSASVQKDSHKS